MTVRDEVLKIEHEKINKRYDSAIESLKGLIRQEVEGEHSAFNGVTEVIVSLIQSRVLIDICCTNKESYSNWLSYSNNILERLDFICFFVDHELLDDGSPTLKWHKYNRKTGSMENCNPDEPHAQPYWGCSDDSGGEYLNFDKVLWTLQWHEQECDRLQLLRNKSNLTSENRKSSNQLLLAIAEVLLEYKKSLETS